MSEPLIPAPHGLIDLFDGRGVVIWDKGRRCRVVAGDALRWLLAVSPNHVGWRRSLIITANRLRGNLSAVDDGVLVSIADLVNAGVVIQRSAARRRPEAEPAQPVQLAILTKTGGPTFRRLVKQVRHGAGPPLPVLVVHDGVDEGVRPEQCNLDDGVPNDGSAIRYCDQPTFLRWAERVAIAAGVEMSLVRWACGDAAQVETRGVGRVRNRALLACVGTVLCSSDDDMLWSSARVGDPESLIVGGGYDPTVMDFFPSYEAAVSSVEFGEVPSTCQVRALGKTVGELVACFHDVSWRAESDDRRGRSVDLESNVVATVMGTVGDSGVSVPHTYLYTEALRSDVGKFSREYQWVSRTRSIRRVSPAWCVTEPGLFMAGSCGFDCRRVLPPFYPGGRNEDSLWSATLRSCDPRAAVAHVPWVVPHLPDPRVYRRDEMWRGAAELRISDVIALAVTQSSSCCSVNVETDIARVGAALLELARLSSTGFQDWLYAQWTLAMERRLYALRRWNATRVGQGIMRDVSAQIGIIVQSLVRGNLVIADAAENEWPHAARRIQDDLRRFGHLLQVWPSLWTAAGSAQPVGT